MCGTVAGRCSTAHGEDGGKDGRPPGHAGTILGLFEAVLRLGLEIGEIDVVREPADLLEYTIVGADRLEVV